MLNRIYGKLVRSALLVVALVVVSQSARARSAHCDGSCNVTCTVCCSSWNVVALCGGNTMVVASTYSNGAEAERVAAGLRASARRCSGDCAGVRFECSGGQRARWAARCSAGAVHGSPLAATSAPHRLIAGLLTAIAYVKPQLNSLATRPDLRRSAAIEASKLISALDRYPTELKQLDREFHGFSGDRHARRTLDLRADITTSRAARDVSSALALVRSRLAIDPHYAEKLRRQAKVRAQAERAAQAAEREREAKLLAEKKAEAAQIAAQEAQQEARAQRMQAALSSASADHHAARRALIEADKRANAALVTAIKFLVQRDLSASGRRRADALRAKLEANKKALAKVFAQLQQPPAGHNPAAVARAAAGLKSSADNLLADIKSESSQLDKVIEDKRSVRP